MQKLYQFIEKNAPIILGDVWLEYPIVIGKFLEHDLMLQSVRTYYDFDRRNLDALIPIEHEDVQLIQFNCFFDLKELKYGRKQWFNLTVEYVMETGELVVTRSTDEFRFDYNFDSNECKKYQFSLIPLETISDLIMDSSDEWLEKQKTYQTWMHEFSVKRQHSGLTFDEEKKWLKACIEYDKLMLFRNPEDDYRIERLETMNDMGESKWKEYQEYRKKISELNSRSLETVEKINSILNKIFKK